MTGTPFVEALAQAQTEILAVFHIQGISGIGNFDSLDISGTGAGNAVLIALSAVLMQTAITRAGSGSIVAELSNLLASLGTDLEQDGTLDSPDTVEDLRQGGIALDLAAVRSNLETRYLDLGQNLTAANFEDFVDTDGDGILALNDDNTPDDFAFTPVSEADPGTIHHSETVAITGILGVALVKLAGGQLIVNCTEADLALCVSLDVTAPADAAAGTLDLTLTEVQEGDTIIVRLAAPGIFEDLDSTNFDTTAVATLTVGTVSQNYTVSTFPLEAITFSFTDETYSEPGATHTSNTIAVSGLTGSYQPVSLAAGTLFRNGEAVEGNAGVAVNGDTLAVQVTASAVFSDAVSAALTLGSTTQSYTVTTRPDGPLTMQATLDGSESVLLEWSNPSFPDFMGIRLLRRGGGELPSGGEDPLAEVIYEGTASSFLDLTVSDGTTYSYGAYAFDEVPRYAPGLRLTASVTTWQKITSGSTFSVALKSDGTLWAWGDNFRGQLGDGTTTDRPLPVQVCASGSGSGCPKFDASLVIAIAAGGHHPLALKSDGTLWGWGRNDVGQLGDGTLTNRSLPVQVCASGSGSGCPKFDASNITAIAAGGVHSLALKSDGTLWAWGSNLGQLGDGTTTSRSLPVQVCASGSGSGCQIFNASTVTAIAAVSDHSLALKSDGTLWTWGRNSWGQLGDGTTTHRSLPVQVCASHDGASCTAFFDASLVAAIAAGGFHSMALKSVGTMWAWGRNVNGGLGDGSTTDRHLPVKNGHVVVFRGNSSVGGGRSLALDACEKFFHFLVDIPTSRY